MPILLHVFFLSSHQSLYSFIFIKTFLNIFQEMTDEMLFSVLGIKMGETGSIENDDTSLSILSNGYDNNYNDNSSEIIDNISNLSECYTDLSHSSSDGTWTDWSSTNVSSPSDYFGDIGEIDYDFDWCLDNNWNISLPDRTPLCTLGCERFLNLPITNIDQSQNQNQQLPQQNQQQEQYSHQYDDHHHNQYPQLFQHDESLIVRGIDLKTLENNMLNDFTNNNNQSGDNNMIISTSANAALATHDYTNKSIEQAADERCFPCTYQGCMKVNIYINIKNLLVLLKFFDLLMSQFFFLVDRSMQKHHI